MKQMKIFKNKESLNIEISSIKALSFVPTMGGLHNGHKYLIKKAIERTKKVLVSIYVNRKQFNSKKDFNNYRRDVRKDLILLKKLKVDYVYLPSKKDIFSFKTKNEIYKSQFSKKLCGKFRKKHFNGVLNVVNRFLEIISPKYIFLGKKDFQQLHLIKMHIKKRKINTVVVACKTIRDKNGLAYSSRNYSLSKKEREIGSKIYHFLIKQKKIICKTKPFKLNLSKISNNIKKLGIKKIDYIDCLNLHSLQKPTNSKMKFNIFVAYYFKTTRLIDNF